MLGTAFPAARVLMVEQPGGWGPSGLADSQFDTDGAHRLIAELGRHGVRVVAVRRPGRAPRRTGRRWMLADARAGHRRLVGRTFEHDREVLPAVAALLADGGASASGHALDRAAAYLVCAHGTHDVCCAIEGRPVAAALDRVRPGAVWESSHLGGDRFAANVLVLPHGALYGRVPVSAVDSLVAATERDALMLPYLRGEIGMTPVRQAALAYARRELDLPGLDQLSVGAVAPALSRPGDVVTVELRIAGPAGADRVSVTVSIEQLAPAVLTCRAAGPRPSLAFRPHGLNGASTDE